MNKVLIATTNSSLEQYQNKKDIENGIAIGGIFILFFIFLNLTFALRRKNGVKEKNYERLSNNPDLNTNSMELHQKRLREYRFSKYKGTTYYLGKKGGLFYRSSSGTRIYL